MSTISMEPEDFFGRRTTTLIPQGNLKALRIQELLKRQGILADSLDALGKPGAEMQVSRIIQTHKELLQELHGAAIPETIDPATLQTILQSALTHVATERKTLLSSFQTSISTETLQQELQEMKAAHSQLNEKQENLDALHEKLCRSSLSDPERNTLLLAQHLPPSSSLQEALAAVQTQMAQIHQLLSENEVRQNQIQGQLLCSSSARDMNTPDKEGFTPLTRAVKMGLRENIPSFISTYHADPNARDAHGKTALQYAAEAQDDSLFKLLVALGADVNLPLSDGYTFLTKAVEENKEPLVRFLVQECGANPNAIDGKKQTPLSVAYKAKNASMGGLLVNLHADLKASDGEGYTIATRAAETGDLETLKIVTTAFQVPLLLNDGSGHSPLTRAVAGNQIEVVQFLLETGGMDPNAIDSAGYASLELAAQMHNIPMMQLLASQGASPLPLMEKYKAQQKQLVSGLEEIRRSRQEELNLDDIHSRYHLPDSVPKTYEEIKKCLQGRLLGTSVTLHFLSILSPTYAQSIELEMTTSTSPFSPRMELPLVQHFLTRATTHFQDLCQTLTHLIQEEMTEEELTRIAQEKKLALDPAHISLGTVIETLQEKIRKLQMTIENLKEKYEQIESSIIEVIEQEIPLQEEQKLSPATYAVLIQNNDLIELLSETNEDLSSPDPEGFTPIERAIQKEDQTSLELLVSQGADLTRSDGYGFTVATRAAEAGRLPFLQYLSAKYHVDLSSPDAQGRTPASIAAEKNHTPILDFLRAQGILSAPADLPHRPTEAAEKPPISHTSFPFVPKKPFIPPRVPLRHEFRREQGIPVPPRPKREPPPQGKPKAPPKAQPRPERQEAPPVPHAEPEAPPPPAPQPELHRVNLDQKPSDIFLDEQPKEGWGSWLLRMSGTILGGLFAPVRFLGGAIWNRGRQFRPRGASEQPQVPEKQEPIEEKPPVQPKREVPHVRVAPPPPRPQHIPPLLPGQRMVTKMGKKGPKRLRLQVIQYLSEGTFKKVYKAETSPEAGGLSKAKAYAEPTTQPTAREDLLHDCSISHLLRDRLGIREVVKIREVRSTQGVGALMEFCDQGTLESYLKKESDPIKRMTLALELVQGLAKMHEKGYCHLDLKLINVLVKTEADGPHIRIGDLGTCQPVVMNGRPRLTPPCGTFFAPEMQEAQARNGQVSVHPGLDLWVLGDMLWSITHNGESLLNTLQLTYSTPYPTFMSQVSHLQNHVRTVAAQSGDPIAQSIAALFSTNPQERPSAAVVAHVLRSKLESMKKAKEEEVKQKQREQLQTRADQCIRTVAQLKSELESLRIDFPRIWRRTPAERRKGLLRELHMQLETITKKIQSNPFFDISSMSAEEGQLPFVQQASREVHEIQLFYQQTRRELNHFIRSTRAKEQERPSPPTSPLISLLNEASEKINFEALKQASQQTSRLTPLVERFERAVKEKRPELIFELAELPSNKREFVQAVRKLYLKVHPDKNNEYTSDIPIATELFKWAQRLERELLDHHYPT